MALRVESRDGQTERQIVIGCITSKAVLGTIAAKWQPKLFPSRWSNIVVGWCVEYFNKYRRAPKRDIGLSFENWTVRTDSKEVIESVANFLENLSFDYDSNGSQSTDALIDAASRLFQRHQLEELKDRIAINLENGTVDDAQELVTKHRKIEMGLGAGIEVLTDDAAMESVFGDRAKSIVDYEGAAGAFFDGAFRRGAFIGLMGKNKVGKSYFAGDIALRSVQQNRNVAYFEVGDQTQTDVLSRFASRWCNRPIKAGTWPRPTRLETISSDIKTLPELETEIRNEKYNLEPSEEIYYRNKWARKYGGDRFKLSCHPNNSITVAGIESIMEEWKLDGWIPDVVVIDYADILAPMNPKADERDQINKTFMSLRAIPQRWHCCLVTPTQADTESFDSWLLTRRNFTGDRRKLDHVTGMVGINQTPREKDLGLYRLNWVVRRDLYFGEDKVLWCASELATANPIVLSTF